MNPESKGSWRVNNSQKRDRWKWSEKNRQRKDGRGETVQKETARDRPKRQAASKFPEAVFPIQWHGFGGQCDLGQGCRSAHTLTRARTHTHPYIIYLFIHNRYKCLSETRKGINSYQEGSGQGRRRRTGARGMFSMQQEGGLAHPTLKNIHLPHGIILMR